MAADFQRINFVPAGRLLKISLAWPRFSLGALASRRRVEESVNSNVPAGRRRPPRIRTNTHGNQFRG
jgi:hypothetical protein